MEPNKPFVVVDLTDNIVTEFQSASSEESQDFLGMSQAQIHLQLNDTQRRLFFRVPGIEVPVAVRYNAETLPEKAARTKRYINKDYYNALKKW